MNFLQYNIYINDEKIAIYNNKKRIKFLFVPLFRSYKCKYISVHVFPALYKQCPYKFNLLYKVLFLATNTQLQWNELFLMISLSKKSKFYYKGDII